MSDGHELWNYVLVAGGVLVIVFTCQAGARLGREIMQRLDKVFYLRDRTNNRSYK